MVIHNTQDTYSSPSLKEGQTQSFNLHHNIENAVLPLNLEFVRIDSSDSFRSNDSQYQYQFVENLQKEEDEDEDKNRAYMYSVKDFSTLKKLQSTDNLLAFIEEDDNNSKESCEINSSQTPANNAAGDATSHGSQFVFNSDSLSSPRCFDKKNFPYNNGVDSLNNFVNEEGNNTEGIGIEVTQKRIDDLSLDSFPRGFNNYDIADYFKNSL